MFEFKQQVQKLQFSHTLVGFCDISPQKNQWGCGCEGGKAFIFALFLSYRVPICLNGITKAHSNRQLMVLHCPFTPWHVGLYFKDFKFQTNFLNSHFADKTDIWRQIFWNIDLLLKVTLGALLCYSSSNNSQMLDQNTQIDIEREPQFQQWI